MVAQNQTLHGGGAFLRSSRQAVVRAGGFEPPRSTSLEPKSSASANSATPAAAAAGAAVPTRPRSVLSTKALCDTDGPVSLWPVSLSGNPAARRAVVNWSAARMRSRTRQTRAFSACSREIAKRGRGGDPPFAAISLVIDLDIAQAVEIVDHYTGGLLQALGGDVAQPVEPLDARPVAEVEMGNRIERPAGG